MKYLSMLLALVVFFVAAIETRAQERFIRVTSVGSVRVSPDMGTIMAYVNGQGDSLEEAIKDFKAKSQKAIDTFDPMEYREMKFNIGKPTYSTGAAGGVAAMMMMGGPGAGDDSANFNATCAVKIDIPLNADFAQEKINELVNKVAVGIEKAELKWDQGGMPTSSGVLKLSLTDPTAAHDDAMKSAIEKARRKASVLAELSGQKIGKVISIEETVAPAASEDDSNPYAQVLAMYSMMMPGDAGDSDGKIEVTSHLEVTFAIED